MVFNRTDRTPNVLSNERCRSILNFLKMGQTNERNNQSIKGVGDNFFRALVVVMALTSCYELKNRQYTELLEYGKEIRKSQMTRSGRRLHFIVSEGVGQVLLVLFL